MVRAHAPYRFRMQAWPRPPSAHAATRAYVPPSFTRRLAAVVTRRAPVAPKGCPMEREPPFVLSLVMSTEPTLSTPGRFSAKNLSESIATRLESTCPAKASWNSMTSMSLRERFAMRSTFEAPYVGPSRSSSKGSQATKAYASSSAFGERPSSEALPSAMRSVAEAPSVKGDAEAAVTVPCGLTNAGLSVAIFSREESARGPSSRVLPPGPAITSPS
mmetsp:Transcript_15382/g.49398  ORF Transcript_15382/g.49398 Transcript_15382/m.49398 type:complete len:217 (-) Transcript_15382:728-1378(-)